MPTIDKVPYRASPYQMLYARCPDCTQFLSWLHFNRRISQFVATCCGFIFDAIHDPEKAPLVFWINVQRVNESNVTHIHSKS